MPVHYAIPRINRCLLPNLHVFRLRFRYLYLCLQFLWISHARQVCAGRYMLAHFHWHQLQYAVDPRSNVQRIHLALLQLIKRFLLIDFCLLRRQSRFCRIRGHCGSFALQL